jgi:hypothetical protein
MTRVAIAALLIAGVARADIATPAGPTGTELGALLREREVGGAWHACDHRAQADVDGDRKPDTIVPLCREAQRIGGFAIFWGDGRSSVVGAGVAQHFIDWSASAHTFARRAMPRDFAAAHWAIAPSVHRRCEDNGFFYDGRWTLAPGIRGDGIWFGANDGESGILYYGDEGWRGVRFRTALPSAPQI